MAGNANLIFHVNYGLLTGVVGGRHVTMSVVSGGGGGAVGKIRFDDSHAVNNPLSSNQKANSKRHVRGGTIPAGTWTIGTPAHRAHLGWSAALTPRIVPTLGHRGGFYIHGRGKHGSDGCLVPMNPTNFHALLDGLTADHGGSLTVHGVEDVIRQGFGSYA